MTAAAPTEVDFQLDLVRRNAESGRSFTKWRDVAICRAHEAGAAFSLIAEAAQMSRQGVQKIVEKQQDASIDNSVTHSVEL